MYKSKRPYTLRENRRLEGSPTRGQDFSHAKETTCMPHASASARALEWAVCPCVQQRPHMNPASPACRFRRVCACPLDQTRAQHATGSGACLAGPRPMRKPNTQARTTQPTCGFRVDPCAPPNSRPANQLALHFLKSF